MGPPAVLFRQRFSGRKRVALRISDPAISRKYGYCSMTWGGISATSDATSVLTGPQFPSGLAPSLKYYVTL
jgi:hypothetical protein